MQKLEAVEFKLYDSLLDQVSTMVIQPNDKILSSIINSLKADMLENCMALIYHHAIVNKEFHVDKIPYKGKNFTQKSLIFNVRDLPLQLQKILWLYLEGVKY